VVAAVAAAPAFAEDERDVEAMLEAFDAGPESPPAAEEPAPAPERPWRLSGSLGLETGLGFDDRLAREYRRPTELRVEGRLQLDVELPRSWKARLGGRAWYDGVYALRGRDRYPSDVLDAYELELEFWESWLAGPLAEGLDVKAGRQILSLGTSETLRVVDLLFPIDNRVPGRADLEDLLLPVAMLRVDWAASPTWNLVGLAFLERRFSELPPPGSGWVPAGPRPPAVDEPGNSWNDTEPVLALRGRFGGVDVSLVGAWFFRDAPSWRRDPRARSGFARGHDRLAMAGATAVGARGDWVWRGEVAGFQGLEFANDRGRHARLDALLGVDYFGLSGSALALDVVHRWIPDASEAVEDAPDFTRRHRTDWAFRWRHDLLRDRLHLTLVAIALGLDFEDGAIVRLQADYAWSDAVSLSAGLLLYGSGDLPPESALGRNDRLFLATTLRF
jgi:hypothetical protein